MVKILLRATHNSANLVCAATDCIYPVAAKNEVRELASSDLVFVSLRDLWYRVARRVAVAFRRIVAWDRRNIANNLLQVILVKMNIGAFSSR